MGKKNFYNHSDRYYEVLKNEPKSYYQEFIDFVKFYLPEKDIKIIDLGCGTGQSSDYLAQAGYRVTGFDYSQRFIDYAKNNFSKAEYIQGDAEKMQIADGSYDALVTFNTVEHLTNLESCLREMIRVVKPGGKLIIQGPNLLSPKLPFGALKFGGQTFEGKKNIFALFIMAANNYCRLVGKSIFKRGIVKARIPNYDYNFSDNDATSYINPLDLRIMLERSGCEIVAYQNFDHKIQNKGKLTGLLSWIFPSGMSIIRIVAQKKKIKITFVNATKTGDTIYPLGGLSIGSYLIDRNIVSENDYKILDINIHNVEREAVRFRPDFIFISAMTISYGDSIKLAKAIKKKLPSALCVIGGVHISTAPWSLDEIFDLGIIGEGEITSGELIEYYKKYRNLDDKIKLKEINGLIFWEDGKIVKTSQRQMIDNLDILPDINWDLLPDDYFQNRPVIVKDKFYFAKVGHILTSRGCPYQCVFCSTSNFWQKLRLFSSRQAAENIYWLYKNKGIFIFNIWDDMFAVSKARVKEFIDIFDKMGVLGKLHFNIQARTNVIDDEMCLLLKKLGVYMVGFGFESGSADMVSFLKGKSTDTEKNKQAVYLLDKHDIGISGSFMLGNPNETKKDLDDTIKFMEYLSSIKNVFCIWFGLTTPFPGTKLWQLAVKQGIIKENCNWKKLDILHTRFSGQAPKLFFNIKATDKEFKDAWNSANSIVDKIFQNNKLRFPEAYNDFERYENNNIIKRFNDFSMKQKLLKIIYKPDKALKVLLELFIHKIIKRR